MRGRTGSALPDWLMVTGLQNQPVACAHHTSPMAAEGGGAGVPLGVGGGVSAGPNICPWAGAEMHTSSRASGSATVLWQGCRQARMAVVRCSLLSLAAKLYAPRKGGGPLPENSWREEHLCKSKVLVKHDKEAFL